MLQKDEEKIVTDRPSDTLACRRSHSAQYEDKMLLI